MKRHLFFLVALFIHTYSLYGQVFPMLGEKTAWRYGIVYYQNLDDTHGTFMQETLFELMEEDSIVDGVTYRKLAITNILVGANSYNWEDENNFTNSDKIVIDEEKGQWNSDGVSSVVLLREDCGRIYIQRQSYIDYWQIEFGGRDTIYCDSNGDTEQVLYDFTLNEGEIYPMIGNVIVESVEQVTTNDGLSRKLFTLSNGMQILEGMGCVNGYGLFIGYQSEDKAFSPYGTWYYSGYAMFYYKNGVDNFDGSFITFSWTTTGVDDNIIKKANNKPYNKLYDLQGRQLRHAPTKGVYIQDGKKRVAF